jgi:hypothetical protein
MTFNEQQKAIADAIALFPAEFGLRAFPGLVFRISKAASYVSGNEVMLYTVIREGDHWNDFLKGTVAEMRSQVRPLA